VLLHSKKKFLHFFQVCCSIRFVAGPLKDIQRLVLKPLLHCLGFVLRVVDLLEDEPECSSSRFSQYFALFVFDSIRASLSVLAAENIPTA
jgi:hypothetical protein